MRSRRSLRTYLSVGLILILIGVLLSSGYINIPAWDNGSSLNGNTTGNLSVYFLDVGQGDSSVILFKDNVILIDAGDADHGDRVVSDLRKLGVSRIDLLVATHPHSDHIGGMQKVLAVFPVGKVLDSGIPSSSSLYERFLETVDDKNIPYLVAERGKTVDLDPALDIRVLSPPEDFIGDDLNTNSIVMRITYGSVNLLFTGDATTEAETLMMKTGYPLDADVLKVSHHGSSDSTSASFLARVDPEVAIISLEKDNDYGHPHRETLERLNAAGPRVLRTDLDGTILVRSDGVSYSVVTEKENAGFWSSALPGATVPEISPAVPSMTNISLPVTLPAIPANITVPVPSLTIPSLQVGNASSVSISSVQFDAPGDDSKNLNGEWVELRNNGEGAVLLTGWTLSDRNSVEPYRFPAFLILPGNTVTIYTGSGVLNDTALYMGRTEPVWGNSGDRATLKDGTGNIIDQWPEAGSS